MRKVVVYEYKKIKDGSTFEKVVVGKGLFHKFGTDYEEFESGPGNYSTAIVEMPDGSVRNVSIDLIIFNKPLSDNSEQEG